MFITSSQVMPSLSFFFLGGVASYVSVIAWE